jgi:peptidoglycan/xylan/chitin deacetylase (PgdA/CDA1 family)
MKYLRIKLLGIASFLAFAMVMSLFSGAPTASAAPSANMLANPSLETATGTPAAPVSWGNNKWGTNTATFTYLTTGRTGFRSVQVQTTAYTSGDAKWSATAVAVTPGTQYTYSDYYKATTSTRFVVEYASTSGVLSYVELIATPSAADWTQASRVFTPPAGTSKARVLHVISAVGTLQIDDANLSYELAPLTPLPPPPTTGNLVPNPSLETTTGSPVSPVSWTNNKWGINTTTFSYPSNGRTGVKSVQIQTTSRTDGDAKWFFDSITVQGNKLYEISNYYKSTVPTRTVLVTYDAANTPSYVDLTTSVPASASAWALTTKIITTPANAVKLTVYHVLEAVGTLQVDDMSVVATAAPTNPIANPSLETAGTATTPASWISNKWGTNTANFEYITNDGHAGTKSAKVTVTNYTDGDAKWYPQPFALTVGNQYRYTAWYKSSTRVQAVVMFTKADGSVSYFGMPQPFPGLNASTTWQQYSETFTVPVGTVGVSPLLYIASNGFLSVDDVSVGAYTPTGFTRPLVSLTFDDGHQENATTAMPIMDARSIKSMQCFATQFIQNDTAAQQAVVAFKNNGHEICSHSITHPFLTSLAATQLTTEATNSQAYLKTLTGAPVKNIASPYGDYNQTVIAELKKYYRSHRTVDEGFNSKDNFDLYRVRVQNMNNTTTIAQYQSWLDQTKANKTWLVLVYHRVPPAGQTAGQFDTPYVDFTPQMDALVASGITVKTYDAALDELATQLP